MPRRYVSSRFLLLLLPLAGCVTDSGEVYYEQPKNPPVPLATIANSATPRSGDTGACGVSVVNIDGRRVRPDGSLFAKPAVNAVEPGQRAIGVFVSYSFPWNPLHGSRYGSGSITTPASFEAGKAYVLRAECVPGGTFAEIRFEDANSGAMIGNKVGVQLMIGRPATIVPFIMPK